MSTSTISYPTYAGAISILESIMLDEKYNPFTRAKIARGVIPKYGLHQHEFACAAAQLTFAKIAQTNETEVNELTLKIEEKLNKLAQTGEMTIKKFSTTFSKSFMLLCTLSNT